jgi:hypothetical protein
MTRKKVVEVLRPDLTQQEWEAAVFQAATYFTVISGRNPRTRTKQICLSWDEAKETAGTDPTKMVYAVSDEGHSVMCPRSLWNRYDQLAGGTK